MAKAPKRAFVCNECGADYPRWQGQCSACNAWNTITEVRLAAVASSSRNDRLLVMLAMPVLAGYRSCPILVWRSCRASQPAFSSLIGCWAAGWYRAVPFDWR